MKINVSTIELNLMLIGLDLYLKEDPATQRAEQKIRIRELRDRLTDEWLNEMERLEGKR